MISTPAAIWNTLPRIGSEHLHPRHGTRRRLHRTISTAPWVKLTERCGHLVDRDRRTEAGSFLAAIPRAEKQPLTPHRIAYVDGAL